MMDNVKHEFQQEIIRMVAKNPSNPNFSSRALVRIEKMNPIPDKIAIANIIMWVFYKGITSRLIKKL